MHYTFMYKCLCAYSSKYVDVDLRMYFVDASLLALFALTADDCDHLCAHVCVKLCADRNDNGNGMTQPRGWE